NGRGNVRSGARCARWHGLRARTPRPHRRRGRAGMDRRTRGGRTDPVPIARWSAPAGDARPYPGVRALGGGGDQPRRDPGHRGRQPPSARGRTRRRGRRELASCPTRLVLADHLRRDLQGVAPRRAGRRDGPSDRGGDLRGDPAKGDRARGRRQLHGRTRARAGRPGESSSGLESDGTDDVFSRCGSNAERAKRDRPAARNRRSRAGRTRVPDRDPCGRRRRRAFRAGFPARRGGYAPCDRRDSPGPVRAQRAAERTWPFDPAAAKPMNEPLPTPGKGDAQRLMDEMLRAGIPEIKLALGEAIDRENARPLPPKYARLLPETVLLVPLRPDAAVALTPIAADLERELTDSCNRHGSLYDRSYRVRLQRSEDPDAPLYVVSTQAG